MTNHDDVIAKAGVKVNDRVKRKSDPLCLGTVKEVRAEITASEVKEKALLVNVLWDNGTMSYVTPGGIEVVESRAG